jgi:tetratricopeptide (TPR) repeat protein
VVLVFLFTRTVVGLAGMKRPPLLAVAVAAMFALHPLQTQAVSYVSQRSEALASGLYLLALLLLLGAQRRGRSSAGIALYLGGLAVFLLGLGAKVIVVTLPAAYLLLAWLVPSARTRASLGTWPRRLALVAPFAALMLFVSTRTLQSFGDSIHVGFQIENLSPATYFVTEWQVLVTYLRLLVWPVGQLVDWFFEPARIADPATLVSLVLLLLLAAAGVALAARGRRHDDDAGAAARVAGFGVFWFLLVLAPTSSIVPLADVIEEHRVYLASWGMFAALVVLAAHLLHRVQPDRRVAAGSAAAALVLCALAGLTWHRNGIWTSRIALWSSEVERRPENFRAHANLGYAYNERGRFEDALREYTEALRRSAGRPQSQWLIASNVATALMNLERYREALPYVERAMELRPDDADPVFNMAILRMNLGDPAQAEALALRTLQLNAHHTMAMNLLAQVRLDARDTQGGIEWLERAIQANPDDSAGWLNLGEVMASLGRSGEACTLWKRAASSPMPSRAREVATQRLASGGCGR